MEESNELDVDAEIENILNQLDDFGIQGGQNSELNQELGPGLEEEEEELESGTVARSNPNLPLYPSAPASYVLNHVDHPQYISHRTARNEKRLRKGLSPLESKKRAEKRPAESGPREIESENVLCEPGFSSSGCYFPYALPEKYSSIADNRIRWNTVKFNPSTGLQSDEFRELDDIDQVVLHLGRARTRMAAAVGIWRKAKNRPFKAIDQEELIFAMSTVLEEMQVRQVENVVENILLQSASFKNLVDEIAVYSSTTGPSASRPKRQYETIFFPHITNWHSELARTDNRWRQLLQADLDSALEKGFHYKVPPDQQALEVGSAATAWLWRNAHAVVQDGPGTSLFRTMYAQAWSYVNLGMLHLYEAVRLLMKRGDELRRAPPGTEDTRIRRLALLPEDFRLCMLFAFLLSTFMNLRIGPYNPSWELEYVNIFIDRIEADAVLDQLKWVPEEISTKGEEFINEWKHSALFVNPEMQNPTIVYDRPAMAIFLIMTHVLALPKDKARSAERERIWSLPNDQKNWRFVGNYIENCLRNDIFSVQNLDLLAKEYLADVFWESDPNLGRSQE